MTTFLDPLIAFVSAHPWLAYLTLFLAALLEAVPVVGALVPGSTIILALSALVPGGELQLVGRTGGGHCRRPARRRLGILGGPSLAARNPRRLADVRISRRDGAERSLFPSLGRAGGVFRPLRAADPRLRAGHGGRAGDGARQVLRRQYSGGVRLGIGARAAGGARGLGAAPLCRPPASRARRQTSVDACRSSGRRSSHSASGRCAAVRPGRGCGPAPDRHSARGAGSAGRAAIARRRARSIRRCAPSRTAPVHGRAAGRAYAPAPPAHNRC